MRRWLADLLAVEAQEAMRRYEKLKLRPSTAFPQPHAELTESGWAATIQAPDWRHPPEWRV